MQELQYCPTFVVETKELTPRNSYDRDDQASARDAAYSNNPWSYSHLSGQAHLTDESILPGLSDPILAASATEIGHRSREVYPPSPLDNPSPTGIICPAPESNTVTDMLLPSTRDIRPPVFQTHPQKRVFIQQGLNNGGIHHPEPTFYSNSNAVVVPLPAGKAGSSDGDTLFPRLSNPHLAVLECPGSYPSHPLPIASASTSSTSTPFFFPPSAPQAYPQYSPQEGIGRIRPVFPLRPGKTAQLETLTTPSEFQNCYQDLLEVLPSHCTSSSVESQIYGSTPSSIIASLSSFHAPREDGAVEPSMSRRPPQSYYPTDQYSPSSSLPTHFLDRTPSLTFPKHSDDFSSDRESQPQDIRRHKGANDYVRLAFGPLSIFPNNALEKLLRLLAGSLFVSTHQLEPTLDSADGQALLKQIVYIPDCPSAALQQTPISIYVLLLDIPGRKCLLCGSSKSSLDRAIGCVRSHLNHRPFVCGVQSAFCSPCKKRTIPAKFFTLSLLQDHIKGPLNKYDCEYPNCNTLLRRGGRRKHWESMHKDRPFPTGTESQNGRKKTQVQASSAYSQFNFT